VLPVIDLFRFSLLFFEFSLFVCLFVCLFVVCLFVVVVAVVVCLLLLWLLLFVCCCCGCCCDCCCCCCCFFFSLFIYFIYFFFNFLWFNYLFIFLYYYYCNYYSFQDLAFLFKWLIVLPGMFCWSGNPCDRARGGIAALFFDIWSINSHPFCCVIFRPWYRRACYIIYIKISCHTIQLILILNICDWSVQDPPYQWTAALCYQVPYFSSLITIELWTLNFDHLQGCTSFGTRIFCTAVSRPVLYRYPRL
jgi:hypothetical protein